MANGNDGEGLLRRVVRKVAGPARELMQRGEDSRLSQFADSDRAELKAMIERKRRNDFVRKRELDMLRRIRREGLTPEQAVALANANLDEVDVRNSRPSTLADGGVKAKIDAIEKQMVGASLPSRPAALGPGRDTLPPAGPPHLRAAPPVLTHPLDPEATIPLDLRGEGPGRLDLSAVAGVVEPPPAAAPARAAPEAPGARRQTPASPPPSLAAPASPAASPATAPAELPPLEFELSRPPDASTPGRAPQPPGALPEVEVREIKHDPELDEAVIAFANAEFEHSERVLVQLTRPGAPRATHIDTWLVLFDLYRAIGQQQRFDALALAFAEQCGCSPPPWYSLPQLLAANAPPRGATGAAPPVGWVAPARLDAEALAQLPSHLLQLPPPWVLDWSQLRHIEPDAAGALRALFQRWAGEPLTLHWHAADRLFEVLQEAAPVGVRDADPAFWLARLDALRLVNRPDQFDDIAIDYCVTYEVSPPSWEPTRCTVRVGGGGASPTRSALLSSVGDVVTSLMDAPDGRGEVEVATLEISGQLAGDQSALLRQLDERLGDSPLVRIQCALLIRVDFIAAGDLLNWVIAKRAAGRHITFIDVNRLVALMFGAMGINEHVQTQLRKS